MSTWGGAQRYKVQFLKCNTDIFTKPCTNLAVLVNKSFLAQRNSLNFKTSVLFTFLRGYSGTSTLFPPGGEVVCMHMVKKGEQRCSNNARYEVDIRTKNFRFHNKNLLVFTLKLPKCLKTSL